MASFLLLVLVSAATAASVPPPPNCTSVREIFSLKNITLQVTPDQTFNGTGMCGGGEGSCCSPEMEASLLATVAKDLHGLLYHNFRSVHGMLASTATALSDEVSRVSKASENKTLSLFSEVYKGMWAEVRTPISELYSALLAYLDSGRRIPTDLPPAVPTEDATTLENIVLKFFSRLFPLVYHQTVHHLESKGFSAKYTACLVKNTDQVKPFGTYPVKLASQVAKSFEATKVLLEALSLGIEVLNTTDHVMSAMPDNTESCREALLRLYYCPKCLGLPGKVKPCNGYCLNVMRGCLTQQRTTELDLPWSNFLGETERLVREVRSGKTPSVDHVLLSFSSTISNAIMYASMNGPELEKRVQRACGNPELVPVDSRASGLSLNVQTPGEGPLGRQLDTFLEAIQTTKARGFFANLAEALCSDDSFAETRDTADCWNGHRVGEYTKALVRPGLDAQKYNPELVWVETSPDTNIRELSDKLRHMRQVVVSRLSSDKWSPESDSLVIQGSGSGWKGDDEEDDRYVQGSGSGYGGIDDEDVDKNRIDSKNVPLSGRSDEAVKPKTTSSSATLQASVLFTILLLFVSTKGNL